MPNVPRRYHKGGKGGRHVREDPTSLAHLQACPLSMNCFRYQSCFEYCERISQIQHHRELVCLFVLHLQNGHVNHYWARMHVCKARMKVLKGRLSKALKRRKRPDPLQILAEASLKEYGT